MDQIALSSPELGEIFIIDHSTTSKEAVGHKGGRSGKGGDILYRWENPQNYNRGDSTNQRLFYQHDVRWVEYEKPGAGILTVFNNNIPGGPESLNYSAIYEISPPMDENGNYVTPIEDAIGPENLFWNYIAPDTVSFYGSSISGAHRMVNGNTFINCGPAGRFLRLLKAAILSGNIGISIVEKYANQTETQDNPGTILILSLDPHSYLKIILR